MAVVSRPLLASSFPRPERIDMILSEAIMKHSAPKILGILVIGSTLGYLGPEPYQATLAVFFSAILLWVTEALPLPVTALLIPVLCALYGVLPAGEAFASFGDDILFLFIGCFLMGMAMTKHGFDRRIAYVLLCRCMPSDSLIALNLLLAGTTYVLSLWISNTAATAIMSAITVGVLESMRTSLDPEVYGKTSARLLLGCAFAASIGGLATPIGSPPNLIALKMLSNHGISIGFVEWMTFGVPISLAMMVVLFLVFELLLPLRGTKVHNLREQFANNLVACGPLSQGERQIGIVFLGAIVLWVLPSLLASVFPDSQILATLSERFTMSIVGLLGGILAFILPLGARPNLEWSEATRIDWGTILLFGGGLTLGHVLEASGTARAFGELIFSDVGPITLLTCVVVSSILLSEFASNTAAAAILIPLVIGATSGASQEVRMLAVLGATFGASFGFMLPVSTPPNAIVYATGEISSSTMLRVGVWFDCIGATLLIALGILLLQTI